MVSRPRYVLLDRLDSGRSNESRVVMEETMRVVTMTVTTDDTFTCDGCGKSWPWNTATEPCPQGHGKNNSEHYRQFIRGRS